MSNFADTRYLHARHFLDPERYTDLHFLLPTLLNKLIAKGQQTSSLGWHPALAYPTSVNIFGLPGVLREVQRYEAEYAGDADPFMQIASLVWAVLQRARGRMVAQEKVMAQIDAELRKRNELLKRAAEARLAEEKRQQQQQQQQQQELYRSMTTETDSDSDSYASSSFKLTSALRSSSDEDTGYSSVSTPDGGLFYPDCSTATDSVALARSSLPLPPSIIGRHKSLKHVVARRPSAIPVRTSALLQLQTPSPAPLPKYAEPVNVHEDDEEQEEEADKHERVRFWADAVRPVPCFGVPETQPGLARRSAIPLLVGSRRPIRLMRLFKCYD